MDVRKLKEEANAYFASGRFAKCVNAYAELIRLEPRDPQLRLRHAEACRRLGEAAQAMDSYEAAARLLVELGHFARAKAALRAALEVVPQDANVQAYLREVEELQQRHGRPVSGSRPRPASPIYERPRSISLEEVPLVAPQPLPQKKVREAAAHERPAPVAGGPQVRRLSETTLAFKPSPSARWVILSSATPIQVSFAEEQDFKSGKWSQPSPISRTATSEFLVGGELLSEEEFNKLYLAGDFTE